MKKLNCINCLLILLVISYAQTVISYAQMEFPAKPYLGQMPPGNVPVLFGVGIVSTNHAENSLSIMPDGREMYFAMAGIPYYVIAYTKLSENRWAKPEIASFSGQYKDWDFNLSPDGKRLFYTSYRPESGSGPPDDNSNIWVVTKIEDGWSEPEKLPFPVNTDGYEGHPSVTSAGNVYFHHAGRDDEEWAIYCSEFVNGIYSKPEKLGSEINWSNPLDPFIAPDESYLIFAVGGLPDEYKTNFYISYRRQDGTWLKAINLSNYIPLPGSTPFVTSDGKYFFFNQYETAFLEYSEIPITYQQKIEAMQSSNLAGGNYWMDAGFIEELKLKVSKEDSAYR